MGALSEAQARLVEYRAAESAVLKNQSYAIKDRQFTRADLRTIREGITELNREISLLQNGGMKVRRIIPRDD